MQRTALLMCFHRTRGRRRSARGALLAAVTAALLFLTSGALSAQVYKFVDENGVVNYTNIAPPSNYQFQTLKFPCYAADPKCRSVSWEKVALNTLSLIHI